MERFLCPFAFFHTPDWLGFYLHYSVNVSDWAPVQVGRLLGEKIENFFFFFFVGSKQNAPDNPACY